MVFAKFVGATPWAERPAEADRFIQLMAKAYGTSADKLRRFSEDWLSRFGDDDRPADPSVSIILADYGLTNIIPSIGAGDPRRNGTANETWSPFDFVAGPIASLSRNTARLVADFAGRRIFGTRVAVMRVEGLENARIVVGENGMVSITGDNMLFLNFGDKARAVQYFQQKLGAQNPLTDITVKQFSVSRRFVDDLKRFSVRESQKREFPDRPLQVDISRTNSSYGLRSDHIEVLRNRIIQGTGREYRF